LPRSDHRSDEEDIIELGSYVRALQRRWKLAVVGILLGGAIGFGIASSRALRYEGVTTLLVVPSSQPGSAQVNPATFRSIVENATLASQVIAELKLEDRLTPSAFLDNALRVEEVRGTNIVKVKVTLADAKTAAEASHRLAAKAIVLTQQIQQQEGASVQSQLKNHLSDAQQRLQTAEKELIAYKQAAQVELIKEDTDAQLHERGDLLRLVVDIAAERARLAAAETEIKRQQPLLSTARVPAAEDALRRLESAARTDDALRRIQTDSKTAEKADKDKKGADPKDADAKNAEAKNNEDLLRRMQSRAKAEAEPQFLDLTNPFVNPVYQTLDFQIATARTRIAALEKERDELLNVKKLGGKELTQLSELYRREIELARLQASFDLATRVYGDLGLRYEQSRTQPVGSAAQLQVVDDALPPDRPVARKRVQSAMFGSAAGLALAALAALLLDGRERRLQPGSR